MQKSLLFVGMAVVIASFSPQAASADTWSGTLSAWQSAGTINIGDGPETFGFTYVSSSNFVSGTTVVISDDIVPGIWNVELRLAGRSIVAAGQTADLKYLVHASPFGIASASLDTTHVGATTDVDKFINLGQNHFGSPHLYDLHSHNGSATGTPLMGSPRDISVEDSVHAASASGVTDLQNAFTSSAPEIGTGGLTSALVLLCGSVALLLSRRRTATVN
ncbi:MAG: hypothetical protein JSS02_33400 [Planctomycetes bacterium]|nr:hypothetical protein [Planctomycetota bacterium]